MAEMYNGGVVFDLPEGFEKMTKDETDSYFNGSSMDYSFILREKNLVVGFVVNNISLVKEEVEKRVNEYFGIYSRMTPGFVMGEMKIKYDDHNCGVFTFKSNAPTRDLFNVFSIANFNNKELCIIFSGTYKDAQKYIPVFVDSINSMRLADIE